MRKPSPFREGPWFLGLRIPVDKVDKELSLKRTRPKDRWECRANRATGNKEDAKTLNTYIDCYSRPSPPSENKIDLIREVCHRGGYPRYSEWSGRTKKPIIINLR